MLTEPSFESSVHGRIEKVLLSIPSWVLRYQRQSEIRGIAGVYRDVLTTLNPNVSFLVITHEESESLLAGWLEELGVRSRTNVVPVPNRTKLSVWAEDTFTVCKDGSGRRRILKPLSEEHTDESAIAESVAEFTGWELVDADRRFQSGNILVGDDFWFMGADSIGRSTEDDELARTVDGSRKLHLIASRKPVPGFDDGFQERGINLGGREWSELCYRGNRTNTVQPIFHIDAFLTLAGRGCDGRYRVLVGDPDMAAQSLEMELPDHAMQAAFDDIAGHLEQLGFSVVRNPLPLVFDDNPISRVRHWYFATANNALVEIDCKRNTVWLPTYGHGDWSVLEKTDRLNEEIWRNLGFETRMLTDFNQFAVNLGAAHCMAKCIVRGER